MERDHRKSFTSKEENDYIHKITDMLIGLITTIGLSIIDDVIVTLESVYGRKNPSATQSKQLKRAIPNTTVLKVLVSSQVFRTKIIDKQFFDNFSKLIRLSKLVNNGELNLDIICGQGVLAEYIESIINILEKIVQNKDYLINDCHSIFKYILPSLIESIDSNNSDLRVESIKALSEICCFYFNKNEQNVGDDLRKQLKEFIEGYFIDM